MDAQRILREMPLRDKIALCTGSSFWRTKEHKKFGIPAIRVADGPHGLRIQPSGPLGDMLGVHHAYPATLFPSEVTLANSWDEKVAWRVGAAIGAEAAAKGVSVLLGPGANIKRNPLGGRNFEYYSEDPLLAGKLAAGFIRGVQSRGISACLKHFAANSQELERSSSDSVLDERTLREIYLAAFETAVREGHPGTVMCAYNKLNGEYCSDSRYLLTDILRREWGFDGLVITDWGAMHDRAAAFAAGCDLNMPGGSSYMERETRRAVKTGALSEECVNRSVERLLKLIDSTSAAAGKDYSREISMNRAVALEAAEAGAVLLKNDRDLLPLPAGCAPAVFGYMAGHPRLQGTGSSHVTPTASWDIPELIGAGTYVPGCDAHGNITARELRRVRRTAAKHRYAVVFAGLPDEYESEGTDRAHMSLPEGVNRLIEAVTEVNRNTVVVLMCGSPVECPWADRAAAILYMGLPGQEGGLACARLLCGLASPGGRLAETWPMRYADVPSAGLYARTRDALYAEGVYVGYRYYATAGVPVRWPFGYGLSYSRFEYSGLRAGKDGASVTVTNIGRCEASDTVQFYVSPPQGGLFRPARELRGFVKLRLRPGESRRVSVDFTQRSFAIWQDGWRVPGGEYTVYVGGNVNDTPLSASFCVPGEDIAVPDWQRGSWYEHPQGQPDLTGWEKLLGSARETPPAGPYTMDSTVRELAATSRFSRLVGRVMGMCVAAGLGPKYKSKSEYRMLLNSSVGAPLRMLQINGKIPAPLLKALLAIANGSRKKKADGPRQNW